MTAPTCLARCARNRRQEEQPHDFPDGMRHLVGGRASEARPQLKSCASRAARTRRDFDESAGYSWANHSRLLVLDS
jgi:hypothetical protein